MTLTDEDLTKIIRNFGDIAKYEGADLPKDLAAWILLRARSLSTPAASQTELIPTTTPGSEPLPCRLCGPGVPATTLVYFSEGCVCAPDHLQALCAQHAVTAEPIGGKGLIAGFDPWKQFERAAASQADIAPTIAEDQLADFLRDQFYHHTNSFAELAAAVCGAFDGGVLRANKPSQAAASQGDGGMPRMTEGAGGALAYYDNRPPPPQSDVISTVTLTEEEMATYNAKQAGQSDEIADPLRIADHLNGWFDCFRVRWDAEDRALLIKDTIAWVNGALTRSRQDGLPTREKLAQCMYDGGIYGVCFWKELSHDHGDRADFLARADAILALIHSGRE